MRILKLNFFTLLVIGLVQFTTSTCQIFDKIPSEMHTVLTSCAHNFNPQHNNFNTKYITSNIVNIIQRDPLLYPIGYRNTYDDCLDSILNVKWLENLIYITYSDIIDGKSVKVIVTKFIYNKLSPEIDNKCKNEIKFAGSELSISTHEIIAIEIISDTTVLQEINNLTNQITLPNFYGPLDNFIYYSTHRYIKGRFYILINYGKPKCSGVFEYLLSRIDNMD